MASTKIKVLDTSKYKDLITGSWTDSSNGRGSWTVDGTDIKGYYKPSGKGNSADLYLDINHSGDIDAGDKKVGFAATANIRTGGSGTWNWSSKAKLGNYFGKQGQVAGLFTISDNSFLKSGSKWDAVLGYLDTSKYKDVISGTWAESGGWDLGYGSWNVNGKNIKGFYSPSGKGNSANLFLDSNNNNKLDSNDKKVGFAATSNILPGDRGAWNWSSKAKLGDYFASNGRDAGQFAFTDKSFLSSLYAAQAIT